MNSNCENSIGGNSWFIHLWVTACCYVAFITLFFFNFPFRHVLWPNVWCVSAFFFLFMLFYSYTFDSPMLMRFGLILILSALSGFYFVILLKCWVYSYCHTCIEIITRSNTDSSNDIHVCMHLWLPCLCYKVVFYKQTKCYRGTRGGGWSTPVWRWWQLIPLSARRWTRRWWPLCRRRRLWKQKSRQRREACERTSVSTAGRSDRFLSIPEVAGLHL